MTIDWSVVADVAVPIFTLLLGIALERFLERKPRLIVYFGHTSAFNLTGPPPFTIHTHSVVIKNTGKKAAEEIRIRHNILPDNFNIFPAMSFQRLDIQGGGAEICIDRLVPQEQITVSYLYPPPLTFSQIHAGITHAGGFASGIEVLPTPQPPKWRSRTDWALRTVGAVAGMYLLLQAILLWVRR